MLVAEDSVHSIPPPAPERTSSNKETTPTPLEFVHTEPFMFARRDRVQTELANDGAQLRPSRKSPSSAL